MIDAGPQYKVTLELLQLTRFVDNERFKLDITEIRSHQIVISLSHHTHVDDTVISQ